MSRTRGRTGVARPLGLFADVRPGEAATALLLALDLFVLLGAYYLLKTIREPLVLGVPGGPEVKSYSAGATAALLVLLVPLYGAAAARLSRIRLINGVTLLSIGCLGAFWLADRAGLPIGVPFFIWVGIFNLMMIAQLWSFAADIYGVEQGKRLFALVGAGAAAGAIAGSFAAARLVRVLPPSGFLAAAALLLGVCLALTNAVQARAPEPRRPPPGARPAAGSFGLILSDRYLMLLAAMMLLVNLVNTTGEYILGRTVVEAYERAHGAAAVGGIDAGRAIGEFYGNFFTLVNGATAILQAFVVSRVIRYGGIRTALLVLPSVAMAGYAGLAFLPVLSFVRTVKIAENSLDYSLQNTARHALYLPVGRAAKYGAKQANDSFFVRLGDVLSALLVFAGTRGPGLGVRGFACVNLLLTALWLLLAARIGRRFEGLARPAD